MYRGKLVYFIKSNPETIYNLLFDIENWDKLLPHCEQIEIEKNDSKEQIAIMVIRNGKHVERIRTVRYFEKNKWISFNQSPPPPLFSIHRGKWTLEKNQNGTRVTVVHEIEVKKGILSKILEYMAWFFFLRNNSLSTLKAIKQTVEI